MTLRGILTCELRAEAARGTRDENPRFGWCLHFVHFREGMGLNRAIRFVCICTPCRSFFAICCFRILGSLAEGQGHGFEIGKDGGPTPFTQSLDRGALSRPPGWQGFLDFLAAFGGD